MDKEKLFQKYSKVGNELLGGYSFGEAEDGYSIHLDNLLEKGKINEDEYGFAFNLAPIDEDREFGEFYLKGK